ncbi:unnamed protein product [Rotaria sordida]|uniref:Mitochondrial carrier protein n=1 Tax=Rotaria sordida TaxID=392033 RepID=A0A815HTL3_9BILA|nr:unnamed protein product [Rotaria sordida]CAF3904406.1 unnamed protein product [Rotaria sordida]
MMVHQAQQIQSHLLLTDSQINSIAGATSGILVSVLVSPLDVVKTHIQVKRLPKGVANTPILVFMYRLGQQEGFRAFYKGLGATMLGYVPNWAVYFTTYQWLKKQFSYLTLIPYGHDMLINLLASIIAGAAANTVIAPMWTIRTRMMTQLNHENYRNSFHAAQKIYQTEGLYALYRGLIPSMLGLIHVGIQFPLYEYFKKKLATNSSSDQRLSIKQLMFASSISKLIASCAAYPHEIVRSRLQNAGHARHIQLTSSSLTVPFHEYKNVRDAVQSIAKEEGLRGFYRGFLPNLIRTIPSAVLTLLSYEKMSEFLADNFGENSIEL